MDLSELQSDNSRVLTLDSEIPPCTLTEPCCVGIDEAGRGPVLGAMVYGIAYCPVSKEGDLKELGVADSKQLKEEDREHILAKIDSARDYVGYCVTVLSPNFISNSMMARNNYNLNAMSHDTAINLIRRIIANGVQVRDVYVDTVGPADKYQAKLSALFPSLNITVESKADDKFPICGASSICAKVVRDSSVKNWKFPEGDSYDMTKAGSGYPSDPNVKKWLSENVDKVFGFPQLVRFSWSTCETILDKQCVKVTWDDEDDEDVPKINAFFKSARTEREIDRHRFYNELGISSVTSM